VRDTWVIGRARPAGRNYVLAGISTSIGVESTARVAWEHSYNLTVVSDATTDTASHAHSFAKIFPRIAEIATTDEIIAAAKA
jgi:nicotinamidase-related amidase